MYPHSNGTAGSMLGHNSVSAGRVSSLTLANMSKTVEEDLSPELPHGLPQELVSKDEKKLFLRTGHKMLKWQRRRHSGDAWPALTSLGVSEV